VLLNNSFLKLNLLVNSNSEKLNVKQGVPMKTKMNPIQILSLITLLSASAIAAGNQKITERVVGVSTPVSEESCILLDADSLHKNPEIDFFDSECPGLGGYRIRFKGGDIRSAIDVSYNKSTLDGWNSTYESHGQFPNVEGSGIEWRVVVKSNQNGDTKSIPYALIYKVTGTDPDNMDKLLSHYVVKLAQEKSCAFGYVHEKDPKTAIAKARYMADIQARSMPCPKRD
jgi:hypothetical protein